ncbi:TraK family protein, partial [Pseudomonas savastanoi]|uniref:TraK family protein n=2 Tax=Pseudomonas savastanoi TaxID=29438 RepID=UPI001CB85B37
MKDWRSAPRNGKAAFLEHREAIQAKLESGYTFKAIYDQLVASESEPPRVSRRLQPLRGW